MIKLVEMKFGSHLYGLNTPDSDIDYKGIYLPTLKELLLHNYKETIKESTGPQYDKNRPGDIDREWMSLDRFVRLAVEGQTLALDMLHCTDPISSSSEWEFLVAHRKDFYTKNLTAFVGYVKRQAAKYGIKGSRLASIRKAMESMEPYLTKENGYCISDISHVISGILDENIGFVTKDNQNFIKVNEKLFQFNNSVDYVYAQLKKIFDSYGHRAKQAEKNDGVDWKAVSHALRAGYQARSIYEKGDFEYPLLETDFLKKVKTGQLDFKSEVSPVLESLVDEVETLSINSELPKHVDVDKWNDWLFNVYRYHYFSPELYYRQ